MATIEQQFSELILSGSRKNVLQVIWSESLKEAGSYLHSHIKAYQLQNLMYDNQYVWQGRIT
jgi:hypothetical protein